MREGLSELGVEVIAREPPREPAVLAALRGVTKSFAGTLAVDEVSLELRAGEVLALVGENGAGKSTCVKLLAGVHRPDAGELEVGSRTVDLHSPLDAQRNGIAVVHQHPGLFGDLSLAENIFAGRPLRGRLGRLDHRRMEHETAEWLQLLGLNVSPRARARTLRTSEQQLVEIARALASDARVLILDEPTASLPTDEVDLLFAVVDRLRQRGVAIMFVGHRLEEIFRISDRIVVLRDGGLVGTAATDRLDSSEVVRMMVGRPLSSLYPSSDGAIGEVVLEAERLSVAGHFEDLSLSLRAGEIVGLAGLVGSGRTELARALFGVDRVTHGCIRLAGEPIELKSSADALARGIAYVSEDRRGQSLVLDFSILANATLASIGRLARAGFLRRRSELGLVDDLLAGMRLRFRDYDQPVAALSGGNQQKVVLAKWLATSPRVLILDEPTQGIDVQAKAEIHRIIVSLASRGVAVLLISSELPELLGMCDRIAVMREGRLVTELDREAATPEAIAAAAAGAHDSVELSIADMSLVDGIAATVAPAATPVGPRERALSTLRRAGGRRELGLLAAIAIVALPVTIVDPRFLGGGNLASILTDSGLLWMVVLGEMLVLVTRNIDLSVGSVVGLTAFVAAATLRAHPGLPIVAVIAMAGGIGGLCGLLNGMLVSFGRVPAIVATLGTLNVFRGIDHMVAGNSQVSVDQVPQAWLNLTSTTILGVDVLFYIGAALLLIGAAALRWTEFGRELFAAGSNPEGARLIGVRVKRRVLQAFVLSGVLAGLSGALWASYYATIDARLASGLELTVIASAVVGGVAIFGGWGTVAGVALGTMLLVVIQNGLALARIDPLWVQAIYGVVIVTAVAIDALLARRLQPAAGAS